MVTRLWVSSFLLFVFLLTTTSWAASGPPQVSSRAEIDLSGPWVGTIIFREGQTELDMVVRFAPSPVGGWSADLDLDLMYVEALPALEVLVVDRSISLRFDLGDGGGERTVDATLSPDGSRIEGMFSQDNGSFPVILDRADAIASQAGPIEVTTLAGVEDLEARFNADDGHVRLVLLLSPS